MTLPKPLNLSTLSVSRLTVRLILLLSLAILPLGLILMYESWRGLQGIQARSEVNLLNRTRRAIRHERGLIENSFGAAAALAGAVAALEPDTPNCDIPFTWIVESLPAFSFAGYVDRKGRMQCASNGSRATIGETSFFHELSASDSWGMYTRPNVADAGQAVFSLVTPVNHSHVEGFIWLAVPMKDANRLLAEDSENVDLVLYDETGEILATEDFSEDRRSVLPAGTTLAELPATRAYTFRATNRKGDDRNFAIVPIVENSIFALGSWPPREDRIEMWSWRNMGLYFPALIWLVCVGVAAVGLHRMVIRHVNRLRHWMRLYTEHRVGFENVQLDGAPEELEAVARTFRTMTGRLAEQERRLEEDLREKTTLLREVHHRVKNNLQVISSIMSMQARNARSTEAKHLIRRLQDRVMALASIHRRLYLSSKLSVIGADELLRDIVGNLSTVGIVDDEGKPVRISMHFEPLPVVPKQSMPLSLILTEAATNAVKHCGADSDGRCWIDIALQRHDDGLVCLSVVNSCSPSNEDAPEPAEIGLGVNLIETFATQLDGRLEHHRLNDRYELHLTFPLAEVGEGDDDVP